MLTFVIHLLYEQIKLEQVLDFTKRSYISYLNKLLHSSFRFKQLVISSIKASLFEIKSLEKQAKFKHI